MEDRTKSLTRYIFTWNIINYGSCVKYAEDLESPAFQLWSPWSSWNLVVKVRNTNEIQICLCRQFLGVGPPVINARFLLCLETLHGTEMWKIESGWLPFTEGGSVDSEILFVPLSSETDETIVVTCDIFLTTKADILRFNPSLKQLNNLEKIFNNNSSTQNIVLNFGKQEKSINFSKDKLCSHCKEFERIFRHCGREFEIRNYSPDVIKSLLKYVHFENPDYLANDRNLFELWPCAQEFVASNLINILQPEFLFRTSKLSLENDRVYKWNYSNFRETLGTSHLIDTTEISLSNLGTSNICTDTRLRSIMFSDMVENGENRGITVLYTHIWNLPVDSSFVMETSVCDNDYIYVNGATLVKPDSEGIFMCYTCIANELLFGTGNLSFPRHIKFNFKSRILQDLTVYSRPKKYNNHKASA